MVRTEDPLTISWMVPSVPPPALRLSEARREAVAECGPTLDCMRSVPSATLAYEPEDPASGRHLQIAQTWPRPDNVFLGLLPGGVERTMAGRTVLATEAGEGAFRWIQVTWTEDNDLVVDINAFGITWDELTSIVDTLAVTDPSAWPTPPPAPGRCVDATTRYAPALIPAGWERVVLQAQPSGTCDVEPYLFMSLVLPGTAAGPGTLVTIVTTPFSTPLPAGEPITINGNDGTLVVGTMGDGTPTSAITLRIGVVAVDAHGTADVATLRSIVESIELFDDAEWAQLVSEVDAG